MHADDIVIIASGKFEETLCDLIQGGLAATHRWYRKVNLKFNPAKTTLVPFTRKRDLPRLRSVRLDGGDIERQ